MCSIQYDIRLFEGSLKQGQKCVLLLNLFSCCIFHQVIGCSGAATRDISLLIFVFVYFLFLKFFFFGKDCDKTIHGQSMRIDTRIQIRAYSFSNISLRWFSIILNSVVFLFLIRSYSLRSVYKYIYVCVCVCMYVHIYIYTYIHTHTHTHIYKFSL